MKPVDLAISPSALSPATIAGSAESSAPLPANRSTGFVFPCLDSIRGVAILMVVAFHAFSFAPQTARQAIVVKYLQGLSLGVPLFFVLSGFLISLIVLRSPTRFSFRNYAIRRFARIGPPFLLSLLLFLSIEARHGGVSVKQAWLALGNIATFPNFIPHLAAINPVSWSLFVEIHFYLVLPLAFLAWRRIWPSRVAAATFATLAFPALACRILSWQMPAADMGERFFLLNRFPNALDYFAWGWLFACIFMRYRETLFQGVIAERLAMLGACLLPLFTIAFTGLLVLGNVDSHLAHPLVHETCRLLISVTAFLMLFSAGITREGLAKALFSNRALIYIGIISYEWFLFHTAIIPPVRFYFARTLHLPTELQAAGGITAAAGLSYFFISAVAIGVSFVFAAAIHRWFSKPLMRRMRGG